MSFSKCFFFFFLRICIYNCIHCICQGFLPRCLTGLKSPATLSGNVAVPLCCHHGRVQVRANTGDQSYAQLWVLVPNMKSVSPQTDSNQYHRPSKRWRRNFSQCKRPDIKLNLSETKKSFFQAFWEIQYIHVQTFHYKSSTPAALG